MEDNIRETTGKIGNWMRDSILFKSMAIGFLVLILLIPIAMIHNLIWERQARAQEAIQEVSAFWGGPQTITGPVLTVPYLEWVEVNKERTSVQRTAFFLPQQLQVKGDAKHQIRKRGIYDVILYQSDLNLTGAFEKPNFSALHINPENVLWDQARLSVGITGMEGIKNMINFDWNGTEFRMEPGTASAELLPSGVSKEVPLSGDKTSFTFSIPLRINGSQSLRFEPVGQETAVDLRSDWPSPSFEGSFPPEPREIGPDGFSAHWQVFNLNRPYPQSWTGNQFQLGSSFGVRLIQPVDEYAKNERSAKYGILIVGLTFLIYFFFETLRKFHIHPFQYLLIGLALSIFYLLLLSLSEQLGFNLAYLIGSVATIGLISLYSSSIFKNGIMTLQLTLLLALIYGFVFVVLQLEDFALLAGSIGLFAALAAVMYYSRRVDWYNLKGS